MMFGFPDPSSWRLFCLLSCMGQVSGSIAVLPDTPAPFLPRLASESRPWREIA